MTTTSNQICGDLKYYANFEGALIDSTTIPDVAYNKETSSFFVYSEDMDLVGLRAVNLVVNFADNPNIGEQLSFEIEFIDPCLYSAVVTSERPENELYEYMYTGASPAF